MALRRLMYSLCSLLVIGHLGLYLAVIDFNRSHEMNVARLSALKARHDEVKKEYLQVRRLAEANQDKLAMLEQTQYKLQLFSKRFPDFARIIDVVCQKGPLYGFHPDLIMGIIQIESAFNPLSVSFRGAYGLMQVHYWVWKDELRIEKERIFDIEYNIDLGLNILRQYARETGGNIKRALMLYNNGYRYNNEIYPEKVNQTAFCMNQKLDSLVTYTH